MSNASISPRLVLHGFPETDPAAMSERARQVQDAGWDGLMLADSPNLTPDVVVALTVAATATDRLELGTAVANPVTRPPAVLASAAVTLQHISHGRAVLGLGRGDSALLQVGLPPEPPAAFERDAARVRRYLHGQTVDEHGHPAHLAWLTGSEHPTVPLQIFASGPRTVAVAGRLGDRATITVGARRDLVAARLDTLRQARTTEGLDPDSLDTGAYLIAAVDEDLTRARALVRGNVAIFAHFQRHATDLGPSDRAVVAAVTERWQEANHGIAASAQADALTDDYIDRFAVLGDEASVATRIADLLDLGLDHLVLIGPSRDVSHEIAREQERRILAAARQASRALIERREVDPGSTGAGRSPR